MLSSEGSRWRHCNSWPSFDHSVQWGHAAIGRVPAVE